MQGARNSPRPAHSRQPRRYQTCKSQWCPFWEMLARRWAMERRAWTLANVRFYLGSKPARTLHSRPWPQLLLPSDDSVNGVGLRFYNLYIKLFDATVLKILNERVPILRERVKHFRV